MTSPPDLNTPFRQRAHNLPSPLTEGFDPKVWEDAFASCVPTEDDRHLLSGTLWIGTKARALYGTRPVRFPGLGSSDAKVLAIALLNREYHTLSANSLAAANTAMADGPITLDYMSNVRFDNAHGQSMSIGDFIESFIDSLDAWLFDAARCPATTIPTPPDIGDMVEPLILFYSMRHILKRLYDKVLHLGHFLDEDGIWVPHDYALASLHQAWFARGEAVFSAAPAELSSIWHHLDKAQRRNLGLARSVTEAQHTKQGTQLKVKWLTYLSNRAPQQPLVRAGIRNSYVADFLDQPLPLAPELTAAMIEDAWWICQHAAQALTAAAARAPHGMRTVEQVANGINRNQLVQAISKAQAINLDVAGKLVTFLTYGESPRRRRGKAALDSDHGWRGLWTAPLVPLIEQNLLLLPRAVFEHCAPLYRVEAWLEKGGLSDQGVSKAVRGNAQRGAQFERLYRAKLCAALRENDMLRTSRIAPEEIKKEDKEGGFPEQIDILFKLGDRLFVGELKFLLTPADPHQWSRHYEKLADAAEQARKKVAALNSRRDVVAAALGLTEADVAGLTITPLIILNSGFGFSLEVKGCRVIDAMYLRDFIRSPEFATGGAIQQGKLISEEVTIIYSSEQDAARRFDAIMAQPGILVRFLDRLKWDTVDYPSDGGFALRIACPFRGDMTPAERERRKPLVPD